MGGELFTPSSSVAAVFFVIALLFNFSVVALYQRKSYVSQYEINADIDHGDICRHTEQNRRNECHCQWHNIGNDVRIVRILPLIRDLPRQSRDKHRCKSAYRRGYFIDNTLGMGYGFVDSHAVIYLSYRAGDAEKCRADRNADHERHKNVGKSEILFQLFVVVIYRLAASEQAEQKLLCRASGIPQQDGHKKRAGDPQCFYRQGHVAGERAVHYAGKRRAASYVDKIPVFFVVEFDRG